MRQHAVTAILLLTTVVLSRLSRRRNLSPRRTAKRGRLADHSSSRASWSSPNTREKKK